MSKQNLLKTSLSLLLLILLGSSLPSAGKMDASTYVVSFHNAVDESLIRKAGGQIKTCLNSAPAAVVRISPSGADQLRSRPEIASVEPNRKLKTDQPRLRKAIFKGPMLRAASVAYSGKGVKVAVIDSGIGPHPLVNVAGGVSFVEGHPSYDDDNGHGTMVAGIIAAKPNEWMQGLAPDVALYAVKALDATGEGNMDDILSGIDWAIQNKMDVINLSFGSFEDNSVMRTLLQRAAQSGISVVVAAGNNGNPTGKGDTLEYPAKYPSVFSVGAVDGLNRRAAFSSTGPELFCTDLGVGVVSTYMGGDFASMDGTSAAAPFITGIIARALEAYPKAPPSTISLLLATNKVDLGPVGRDPLYGYGLPKTDLSAGVPVDAYGHWARSDIVFTQSKGWMNGVAPYVFLPDKQVTRAESATTLIRALGMAPSAASAGFTDVPPSHWAYRYVNAARASGLVDGLAPHLFAPDAAVSREQMAELLFRALKLAPSVRAPHFSDMQPGRWSYPAVAALAQAGVLDGFPDGTFRPADPLTRGQIAAILRKCAPHFR